MLTQAFAMNGHAGGWRPERLDAVLSPLIGVAVTPDDPRTCSFSMQYGRLPSLVVSRFQVDPLQVERDPACRARPRGELLALLQQEGRMTVTQDGRTLMLDPGDIAIVGQDRPYRLEALTRVGQIGVLLPPAVGAEAPPAHGPRRLSRRGRLGRLCHEFADVLLDADPQDAPVTGVDDGLVGAFLQVWRAALRDGAVAQDAIPAARDDARLYGLLARRSAEEDLSPRDLAADLGVSVRTLHYLFARRGTTFRAALARSRLEAAAARLRAPALAECPITAIALEAGFRSPSAFSTAFRAWTGESPRAWRARHLAR